MGRLPMVLATPLVVSLSVLPAAAQSGPSFATPAQVANLGAATRPLGIAAGDFNGDGVVDIVAGLATGQLALIKGAGDGTFLAPATFEWRQAAFNAWALAAADVNGDRALDLVWGANSPHGGCSVWPIPFGQTCASAGGVSRTVNDGEVRVFLGNGDGSFEELPYYVSGVRHNAGRPLADIGSDAGSLAAADVDGDGDVDIVAGAAESSTVVRLLRNSGRGTFGPETIISQPTAGTVGSPTYYPPTSTLNSPWGLALGDADGDGDVDLWVGDRALYVYLWLNDGTGKFTLQAQNDTVAGRSNVYLGHDPHRAVVGYTPSLGAGDLDGDGRADLVLGLQSGGQSPSSGIAHDGELLLDLSTPAGHSLAGTLADIGTMARGVTLVDVDGDGYRDIVAAEYDGAVVVIRQVPSADSDGDGVPDGRDNAPTVSNLDQGDADRDGIGDVVDGAAITEAQGSLMRYRAGTMSAVLTNGAGRPIAQQTLSFAFDADGDGSNEDFQATTDGTGRAAVDVMPTRPAGATTFTVAWDGWVISATATASVTVGDVTALALDPSNPTTGEIGDTVAVAATLVDGGGFAVAGQVVRFAIGDATAAVATGPDGRAAASLVLGAPAGPAALSASFAPTAFHEGSSASSAFTVAVRRTRLALSDAVAFRSAWAVARAVLSDKTGAPLARQEVTFFVEDQRDGQKVDVPIGAAVTGETGAATLQVHARYAVPAGHVIRARYDGSTVYAPSSAQARTHRR